METPEHQPLKFVTLGQRGTGRGTLMRRLWKNQYWPNRNFFVDFATVSATVDGIEHPYTFWAYQATEEFKSVPRLYARNAVAGFALFDVTSRASLDTLTDRIAELRDIAGVSIVMVLVASKIDVTNRVVSTAEGQLFADRHGMLYAEISSKTGEGIAEMIESAFKAVLAKIETGELEYQPKNTPLQSTNSPSSFCAC